MADGDLPSGPNSVSQLVTVQQNGVIALNALIAAINAKFPDWVNVPATATSAGVAGQVAYDATHFYVCVSSNVWVRTTLATF